MNTSIANFVPYCLSKLLTGITPIIASSPGNYRLRGLYLFVGRGKAMSCQIGLCKCYFDSGTGAKEKNKRQQFIIKRKKIRIMLKAYINVGNIISVNFA